jgi:hypothetical protein
VTETKLGRIKSAHVGYGGYEDAMFGASFELGGDGWGTGDFWGTWSNPPSSGAKWTLAAQSEIFAETMRKLIDLLTKAKVTRVEDLKDIPIEVVFENQVRKSWRILEEVL